MATNGEIEEDLQTDEMIRSERPIMRTLSFRRRLRGKITAHVPLVDSIGYYCCLQLHYLTAYTPCPEKKKLVFTTIFEIVVLLLCLLFVVVVNYCFSFSDYD